MTSSGPHSLPPMSLPYPPGTVLAGKYRVERLLGKGGMGWVVVATHLQLEQRVALKFMNSEHAAEHPDSVARFIREARAAARIQSEYVARVSDVGTLENGSPYLVMEYLEGRDMEALVRSGDKLPLSQLVTYVLEACEGLAEAHAAGIVHRDLKPANLFLARRTDGSVRAKLLDFGISKLTSLPGAGPDIGMTSTQALMGSPLYMSPEQLRSSKNVDRRTDIWSMGVILYECLTGTAPFEAETLPEVCARIMAEPPPPLPLRGLPRGLDLVVMKCLEKDALKRFGDTGALATALAPFGGPDARAQAERIVRVARSSNPSLAGVGPNSSGEMPVLTATAASGIGQTNASLVRSSQVLTRRVSGARVVIGLGVALLGIAFVVGLVATRSRHTESPGAAAAAATSATAPPPASATAPASAPAAVALVAPSAGAADTSASADTGTAPSAAQRPVAPSTPGRRQPTPQPRPTPAASAPPPAAPSAKPASTSGFGGRD